MKRYELVKDDGTYGNKGKYFVIDKLKTLNPLFIDARYSNTPLPSVEYAKGFMFGKGKNLCI